MVHTMIAYSEVQAANGLTPVAAVPDQHVTVSGDDIIVPKLSKVLAAAAIGANLVRAKLISPSLAALWYEELKNVVTRVYGPTRQAVDEGGAATYVLSYSRMVHDRTQSPLSLKEGEKLNAHIDNANNNERQWVIVTLGDGVQKPVTGNIKTIRATASITGVAGTWVNGALTLDATLPKGRYAVVGMRAQGATLVAARLVFPGDGAQGWRPGCLGCTHISDARPDIYEDGKLGVWGEFESIAPPTLDVLCGAGDTAQVVLLDLVPVRID